MDCQTWKHGCDSKTVTHESRNTVWIRNMSTVQKGRSSIIRLSAFWIPCYIRRFDVTQRLSASGRLHQASRGLFLHWDRAMYRQSARAASMLGLAKYRRDHLYTDAWDVCYAVTLQTSRKTLLTAETDDMRSEGEWRDSLSTIDARGAHGQTNVLLDSSAEHLAIGRQSRYTASSDRSLIQPVQSRWHFGLDGAVYREGLDQNQALAFDDI